MTNDTKTEKFKAIPENACRLEGGSLQFGEHKEGDRSTPVTILARSPQPIEHWWWGKVVHDMSGMILNKSRIVLDYCHDPGDVLGYANHIEATPEKGVVLQGALTPFGDSDRASEVIAKWDQGVPYEASIDFAGDGIKVQWLDEGEMAEVNGFIFEGPGAIIREWPLRGTAICPYGADQNTAVAFSRESSGTFAAEIVENEETNTGDIDMSDNTNANPQPETVDTAEQEASKAVERLKAEEEAKLQAAAAEAAKEAEERVKEKLSKLTEEFGAEIATKVFAEGGDREMALKLKNDVLEAEVARLKETAEKLSTSAAEGGNPAETGGSPNGAATSFSSFFTKK